MAFDLLLTRSGREREHAGGRQALLRAFGILGGPHLLARAAVDPGVTRRAQLRRALRALALLALRDLLLDLHEGGDQRLRRGRAARHVDVDRDDLVDALHRVIRTVE